MEYIKNSNGDDISYTLYPQAKYKDAATTNYSNSNDLVYPAARQISNNINFEFNNRLESADKVNEALEIIKKSVGDEAEDLALYSMMINQAIQDEDKDIITSIANDEKKHNAILRQIYFSLTGTNLPTAKEYTLNNENTYISNLKKSLFGELEAAKKYRKVLSSMTNKDNYNSIMGIMVDELTHANKYNYLITKYMVNHEEAKNMK